MELTCIGAVSAWLQRVSLALTQTPDRGLLIDSVLIDRVDVVLWRLQGSNLRP